ncbi:HAD family hydrolase [Thermogemmatispora onikobensis]|uniref:HAD family hydrolase n=1 Tax=Thermogemmatispora onikobensis TaxID=732234 RepID=UPI0008535BB8|nr:HAD hydrolase family protein [Thermogemmatispora onikobensis]
MIRIEIPQRETIELKHAVFDINGTLAFDGKPWPEVVSRLKRLTSFLSIHLLTAATHGQVAALEHSLGLPLHVIDTGEEKTRYVEELGPANVIAFGNGVNDAGMLRRAAIGVAVLGPEGVAREALQAADVLVRNPIDGIDLLFYPKRLIATLRP